MLEDPPINTAILEITLYYHFKFKIGHLFAENKTIMENLSYNNSFILYDSISELPSYGQNLIKAAWEALDSAYAPYSHFLVGSAVLLTNDALFKGSNQENASYPLCMCAERVALYNAGTYDGLTPVRALSVVSKNLRKPNAEIASPCGACRQVILEYENRFDQDIEIFISGLPGQVHYFPSAKHLLPFSFSKENLL